MASKSKFLQLLATQRLKDITKQSLSQEQEKTLKEFKIQCKSYLQAIDQLIKRKNNELTLQSRIMVIGQLMHPSNNKLSIVQDLLNRTLEFENKFNQYLGRQIPITWISTTTGEVHIATYKDEVQLFKNAKYAVQKKGSARSYRGLISGVNENSFKNQLTGQLKELQNKINQQTKNRAEVYLQSLRRYDKTSKEQKDGDPQALELAKKNIGKKVQYWRKTIRGDVINWEKINSRGFIGQGYIALILNHPYSGGKIHFDTSQMPDYNLIAQDQIESLAEYAAKGDAVPGALQGDVKVDDGHIQLAVKQGPSFHTASITIDVAIAYAFLQSNQPYLLSPQNINKSLENLIQKSAKDTTSWEKIYQWLVNQPIKKVKGQQLKIIIDIK